MHFPEGCVSLFRMSAPEHAGDLPRPSGAAIAVYGVLLAIQIFIGGETVLELRGTPSCSVGSNCWWEIVDTMPVGLVIAVPFAIPLCLLAWFDFIKQGWRKSGWLAFVVSAVVAVEIALLSFSSVADEIAEQILR